MPVPEILRANSRLAAVISILLWLYVRNPSKDFSACMLPKINLTERQAAVEVDDTATADLQQRQQLERQQVRCNHVNCKVRLESIAGLAALTFEQSGVVDEDIQAVELCFEVSGELAHAVDG
jgi:hypothetical protein